MPKISSSVYSKIKSVDKLVSERHDGGYGLFSNDSPVIKQSSDYQLQGAHISNNNITLYRSYFTLLTLKNYI